MSGPESSPRHQGTLALIVVGIGIVVLILMVAAVAGLGLFATTSSGGDEAGPVQVVEETVTERDTLPDGETFGFILEVSDRQFEVDPARLLTGAEAAEVAAADGVTLEIDFYIDNPGEESTQVPVAADALVMVLNFDASGAIVEREATLAELASAVSGEGAGQEIYGAVPGQFPATVLVEGGRIAAVEQVYLP